MHAGSVGQGHVTTSSLSSVNDLGADVCSQRAQHVLQTVPATDRYGNTELSRIANPLDAAAGCGVGADVRGADVSDKSTDGCRQLQKTWRPGPSTCACVRKPPIDGSFLQMKSLPPLSLDVEGLGLRKELELLLPPCI
ncbi:hypothetical protein C0Q70_07832 [Pomacea canaliculata]|uniref:Uncharacterized protein n=1 Tax=Pomacea canaliculata TaxID=400727 RepID=A0A2T7PG40_POMCA|nr:hypothetical protein C0Q70_07832 [Pomacea canaliculata]